MQPSLQVGTEGPGRLQGGRHGVALCASWSADLSGDQLKRAYHWRPYGRADAEQWQLPSWQYRHHLRPLLVINPSYAFSSCVISS